MLIINPISGKAKAHRRLVDLTAALQAEGYELIERRTTGPGDATALAASAGGQDVRAVLVYGGDGTIREAAAGLADTGLALMHLPGGNENLFATHFRMRWRLEAIVESLRQMRTRRVDLLDVNGQICTSCMGVGLDSETVVRVAAKRRGHISDLGYAGPIAAAMLAFKPESLSIRCDGELAFDGPCLLMVGNLTRYAMGIPMYRRAVDDDGLMDVMILPCRARRHIFGHFVRVLFCRHDRPGSPYHHRCRTLEIAGPAGKVSQIDGDLGPPLPLTVRVRSKVLSVLLPPTGMEPSPCSPTSSH